jgi:PAS domain-containing protein
MNVCDLEEELAIGTLVPSAESGLAQDWLLVAQEIAGVGIWDWRIDQPTARCTESNTLLYGLPPSTFMPPRELWQQLIHPDDRRRVLDELDSAVSGRCQYQTEFRVIWPDGSIHWLAGKGRGASFVIQAENHSV